MRKLLLPLLLLSSVIQAQTSATLNRKEGPVATVFELKLESEQRQSLNTPDFSPLEQDFSILNNSKVSVSNFRNGVTLYKSTWTLRLRPKHVGELKIPGIRVGAERSRSLVYSASDQGPLEIQPDLFVATSITPDLNYSRAAFVFSVKLYFVQTLTSAELTEPQLDNVLIERLGPQRNYGEIRNGQDFQVIEQRYVLFPLTSGRFTIPPIEFSGANTFQQLNAQSESLSFEALRPPPEISSKQWLAATELRIDEQWQPANFDKLQVGDTLIRTLVIEGHNIPASWLPTPELNPQEGVSIYLQAPELSQQTDTGILVSRKTIQYKLLLTRSGNIELPAIKLKWWDVIRDEQEVSELNPVTIPVSEFKPFSATTSPKTTKAQTVQSDNSQPLPNEAAADIIKGADSDSPLPWMAWLWAAIALVCATGWSLTQLKLKQIQQLMHTLKARQQVPESALKERDYMLEETNAFNRLSRACCVNAPEDTAQQLVQWAKFTWPNETIGDLADVEICADDPTLSYLLRDMEHHLYRRSAEDDPWQGDLVLNQVTRLRKRIRSSQTYSRTETTEQI
ncbi:MAG: BatD family protein [Motiliproteus sp.]